MQNRDCPDRTCVIEKAREFFENISNPNLSINDCSEALKYLVHLIADLHQPLHLGNRKDRGGNNIRIIFRGKQTNLHALWDSGLVNIDEDNLLQYANFAVRRVTDPEKLIWTQSKIIDWANESRKQALDTAYNTKIMSTGTLYVFSIVILQKSRTNSLTNFNLEFHSSC